MDLSGVQAVSIDYVRSEGILKVRVWARERWWQCNCAVVGQLSPDVVSDIMLVLGRVGRLRTTMGQIYVPSGPVLPALAEFHTRNALISR